MNKFRGIGKTAILAAAILIALTAVRGVFATPSKEGAYGMALVDFRVDKKSAAQNEEFTVSCKVKNMSLAQGLSGGQFGAAFVDNNGEIAEFVGFTDNTETLAQGQTRNLQFSCFVPLDIKPGRYKLRAVVRPGGDEWRVITLSIENAPPFINFTVTGAVSDKKHGLQELPFATDEDEPQEQPQPSVLEDEPQQEQQTQNFVPVGIKTLPAPMPSVQDEKPAQTQVENQSSETKTASKDVRSNEQIEKIRAKYLEYKPRTVKDIYVDKPNTVKPYSPGSLTPEFLQNGLNMLKFMRFLAGLSEDVVYTPELNDLAQHGAVILAANGKITHTPSQPSDMDETFYKRAYKSTKTATLYWSSAKQATLEAAVRGFFDDSDRSNIDRLGHRRWMLKPSLKNVGFGCAVSSAGTFIPIQVFDISGKEKTDMPYVQYPAPGYFPAAFFRPTQAWSVNLSPKVYDLIRCKPNVKLTCLDDGRQWDFSLSDTDKDGKYFNVDESVFGRQYCIIFRPDSLGSLDVNRRFKVEISGVVDKVGKLLTIEYEVEFFQDDVFGK